MKHGPSKYSVVKRVEYLGGSNRFELLIPKLGKGQATQIVDVLAKETGFDEAYMSPYSVLRDAAAVAICK